MLINVGDIADGVLVSAINALVRMVKRPYMSQQTAADLAIARWSDTEALIRNTLPGIRPQVMSLTDEDNLKLVAILERREVQSSLQALLAARLTDAPEGEAARAREAVGLSISGGRIHPLEGQPEPWPTLKVSPLATRHAEPLSQYFDDKICALVGHLEGAVGFTGLSQIRNEAHDRRILALLRTIADMLEALRDPQRGGLVEANFLERYAKQARERHGKLQPPDFERRRKIAADKIYVNTDVYPYPDTMRRTGRGAMKVMDLAACLDRTVLLGDPGGGKTTAADMLANHFASSDGPRIPFVVTLREYAAADLPDRSVPEHIEHSLKTLYQCPAPAGLIERLLLTGRAVVIFDGLDELLDTSRRRDVSERVEQFCSAYPLTQVLVTSRLIGYDQAMLDRSQFTCYQLGDFGDEEVAEYAHKWFAIQEEISPAEAEVEARSFVVESRHAQDVRSNPLLLSLMCILYRGAGTLPRDRPTIYAKCAELLLGRWDESRRIRHELRAGRLVEPAIQHLAWWLFTSGNPGAAVTERHLIEQASAFLQGRTFESAKEARAAASEFAAFLRGRMWVLSDVGTNADGEKLYAFTHRTFLEYFTAAHLAAVSDTPEVLAAFLVKQLLSDDGWLVTAELSLQIKSRACDRGADRFYEAILNWIESRDSQFGADTKGVTKFLEECIDIVEVSPGTARRLTRAILGNSQYAVDFPLERLFQIRGPHNKVIGDEAAKHIATGARSSHPVIRAQSLELIFSRFLAMPEPPEDAFNWRRWAREQIRINADQIAEDSISDYVLRNAALHNDALSLADALRMPGGPGILLDPEAFYRRDWEPYLTERLSGVNVRDACGAVGRYLMERPFVPWVRVRSRPVLRVPRLDQLGPGNLGKATALGFAALTCVAIECRDENDRMRRCLDTLPVPRQFQQLFRDWTARRIDFVEIAAE